VQSIFGKNENNSSLRISGFPDQGVTHFASGRHPHTLFNGFIMASLVVLVNTGFQHTIRQRKAIVLTSSVVMSPA